jgi:hypothetical protein
MSPYAYLFLFALGIFIMQIGSYFTVNYENNKGSNADPLVYSSTLTLVFSGLFLSVHALIKMWKIGNEQVEKIA